MFVEDFQIERVLIELEKQQQFHAFDIGMHTDNPTYLVHPHQTEPALL